MTTPDLIVSRYELVERVASGGFGHVYRAKDSRLGRSVAIKVLRQEYANDGAFRARFAREAQLASSVSHPSVVSIFDYGEHGDLLYLVMEWISGPSLQQLLDRERVLPWPQAAPLVEGLLDGLAAIHAVGTVHRDVSLRNALLAHPQSPKIIDFGIAKGTDDLRLTKTGMTVGSPLSMAPEQITGNQISPATDLYALGTVLFHLLTGQPVFTAENSLALVSKHLHEQPRDPRSFVPAIPDHVAETILTCLAKEPSKRYPTANAVATALFAPTSTPRNHEHRSVTEFAPLDKDVSVQTVLSSAVPSSPVSHRVISEPQRDAGQVHWLVLTILFWSGYLVALAACFIVPYQVIPDRTSSGFVCVICLVWLFLILRAIVPRVDARIRDLKQGQVGTAGR